MCFTSRGSRYLIFIVHGAVYPKSLQRRAAYSSSIGNHPLPDLVLEFEKEIKNIYFVPLHFIVLIVSDYMV